MISLSPIYLEVSIDRNIIYHIKCYHHTMKRTYSVSMKLIMCVGFLPLLVLVAGVNKFEIRLYYDGGGDDDDDVKDDYVRDPS